MILSTEEWGELRKYAMRTATCIMPLAASLALGFSQIIVAKHKAVPTFTHDVAPILFKHCVKCHQRDELASGVPLTSYDEVRPRAELIKQKIISGEMPPWPADPKLGSTRGLRRETMRIFLRLRSLARDGRIRWG